MKKWISIIAVMCISIMSIPKAHSQINIQINIGSQPAWGPTGYDYAHYYYFPDYNFYYDVMTAQYIIYRRNSWVYTSAIPASYGFNPYRAYKVVVNQQNPYAYNATHIRNYARYKGQWARQPLIRDSRDSRYYASAGHPRHNEWRASNQGSTTSRNTVTTAVKRPTINKTTTNRNTRITQPRSTNVNSRVKR